MAEEKNFENRVKQWLRSKGCYVVKYYGCGGTRAGVPDLRSQSLDRLNLTDLKSSLRKC